MAQPIREYLSGGLVTTRDKSLLLPDEVSVAQDVMVKPGSPSLYKVPGRAVFNPTALPATAESLAYCAFDSAADLLVMAAGGSYYTAPAGETGAFTSLSADAGAIVSSISMLDRNILLGGTRNIVLLSDGTTRPVGLLPVSVPPAAVVTTSGGSWPLGANQLGYFEYWITEVYKSGNEEVEGTFTGKPVTVNVATTASYVTVTRPSVVNGVATHWRVYRSLKKTNIFDQAFPVGFLIAELPVTTSDFADGLITGASAAFPTTASAPTVPTPDIFTPPIMSDGTQSVIDLRPWNNPDNVKADDAAVAVSGTLGIYPSANPPVFRTSELVLSNFGFTGIGDPVDNIKVIVEGTRTAGAVCQVYLSWNNGVSWTAGQTIPISRITTTIATVEGGSWGRVWSGAEMQDGAFKVLIRATGLYLNGTDTVTLDYVKVSFDHGGVSTVSQQTVQFPNLQIIAGPSRLLIGSNSPPPLATTGDIFQSAMVTNDLENPTNIAWTIPGTFDYSPIAYRLALDTAEHDEVRCIMALNSVCIIGAEGSMHRMNYVPVVEDPEFNVGRCIDKFDSDSGIVGPKAAVRVTVAGQPMLFYISPNNLHLTNGFTVDTATDDISWPQLADRNYLHLCFVLNNVSDSELLVHYPAAGSNAITKVLRLNYHNTHLKNGKLKVAGITNYAPVCGTTGISANGTRTHYTAKATTVYIENRNWTDASGGSILPRVTGREMLLAGHGQDWELQGFGIHHQGGGGTISTSCTTSQTNIPEITTSAQDLLMTERMLSVVDTGCNGTGIAINITGADDGKAMVLDYLVLFPEGLGETVTFKQ